MSYIDDLIDVIRSHSIDIDAGLPAEVIADHLEAATRSFVELARPPSSPSRVVLTAKRVSFTLPHSNFDPGLLLPGALEYPIFFGGDEDDEDDEGDEDDATT